MSVSRPIAPKCFSLKRSGGSLAFGADMGPKEETGLGHFTQNYMITKKLTFNLRFESTKKIFSNYVLGTT